MCGSLTSPVRQDASSLPTDAFAPLSPLVTTGDLVYVGYSDTQARFTQRGADPKRGFIRRNGVTISGRLSGLRFFGSGQNRAFA